MKTEFENPVDFLKKIIQIESISGNEQNLSDFLGDFLQTKGFKILNSDIGNAVGVKGKGNPIVLLASHLDTVPTNNPFKEENGKLYGMGAVDCKPSLAAMFFSAANTEWEDSNGTLIIAGIVEEEISHKGMLDYFKNGIAPDYAIFGEPTNDSQVCVGYKGRLLVKLNVSSETGHAACCWQYDNPAELIIYFINSIKEFEREWNNQNLTVDEESKFQELTTVVTNMDAKSTDNTIPNTSSVTIDIRIPPKINTKVVQEEVTKIIQNIKSEKAVQDITVFNLEYLSKIEACESQTTNILPNALKWAIFQTLKKKATLVKKTGTTFTNLISAKYNIPTVTYGPGDPKLEHSDNEFIEIQEYLNVIEIYKKFFRKFNELYEKSSKRC